VVWLKIERRKGWPDRILMVRNKYIWCELKVGGRQLDPMQRYIHALLKDSGARVTIIRSVAQLKKLIRRLLP
jgi:hypothetical protein